MKSLSLGRGVPLNGIREGVIAIKCEFDAAAMQMDIPPLKLLLLQDKRPAPGEEQAVGCCAAWKNVRQGF
jgi:hypothetical protein